MRTGNPQNDMPNQNPLRVARGALPLLLLAALAVQFLFDGIAQSGLFAG